MNLESMLPAIAYLPTAIGLPTSPPGEFAEIFRILLCLALIVVSGGIAAACVDGLVAEQRSPVRARELGRTAAFAALRSAIIRCYLTLKGK